MKSSSKIKTLSIKNGETYEMARRLSIRTGESITKAVNVALTERLARIEHGESDHLAEELLAIGRECSERLKEPFRTSPHGDLLYDDEGLPR